MSEKLYWTCSDMCGNVPSDQNSFENFMELFQKKLQERKFRTLSLSAGGGLKCSGGG
jgi:hypothetical protein